MCVCVCVCERERERGGERNFTPVHLTIEALFTCPALMMALLYLTSKMLPGSEIPTRKDA